ADGDRRGRPGDQGADPRDAAAALQPDDRPRARRLHPRPEQRRRVRIPQRGRFPVQDGRDRGDRDGGAHRRRDVRGEPRAPSTDRAARAGAHHRRRRREPDRSRRRRIGGRFRRRVLGSAPFLGVQRRRFGDLHRCRYHDSRYARGRSPRRGALMYPRLFELGPITVYTYGVLLAAAYLLGLQLARVRARKRGLDQNRVLDLGIYIIISALVGAKLLLLVTDYKTFSADPRELLTLARSGGVFYGGLILAVAVALWYIRRIGLPLWTTCDVFAPGIALGHVVGRFGCLFAGCCYGKPTTVPWAITFTDPFAASNVGTPLNQPLHPTQLYEAGAELLILGVLLATERKGKPFAGRTFW